MDLDPNLASRTHILDRTRVSPYAGSDDPLPQIERPISQFCTENQFNSDVYSDWCAQMNEVSRYHRKQWEFVYILQALKVHGKLGEGRTGLGFGVGKEPLSAVMAKLGCRILATDLDRENAAKKGWVSSNQNTEALDGLNDRGICDAKRFKNRVGFQVCDMNAIDPSLMTGSWDFTWSSCALEHLGSLAKGIDFIFNSLKCLKPGGVAVHTTEYNISSNVDTLDRQGTVLYRRRDVLALIDRARAQGIKVSFNPNYGRGQLDLCYDIPPYQQDGHLKLLIGKYVATSLGLILRLPS